jgi:hypothetical protein
VNDDELVAIDKKAFDSAARSPGDRGPHIAGLRAVYDLGLSRAAEIAREQARAQP